MQGIKVVHSVNNDGCEDHYGPEADSPKDTLPFILGSLPILLALYFVSLLVWRYMNTYHCSPSRRYRKPRRRVPKLAKLVLSEEQRHDMAVQAHRLSVVQQQHVATTTSSDDRGRPLTSSHSETAADASGNLCKGCGLVPAKTGCRYDCCRPCCSANVMSVCAPHNTGARVADMLLDEAIQFPPNTLDISYQHLRTCSPRLGAIGDSLTSLNLSNNLLRTIPESIGNLVNVEELFLQYNLLSELPESISSLTQLAELDCKNNLIKQLPDSIGQLTELVILNVTNNFLRTLPESICNLVQLEELCLHANNITKLPNGFCRLLNLASLYMGHNKLASLPDDFGKLCRLNELDLSDNELLAVPESFVDLVALERLWLSKNRLKRLPNRMGSLSRLSELHVQDNDLRYLPLSISTLRLYTLTSNGNPFFTNWSKTALRKIEHKPAFPFPSLQELSARVAIQQRIPPSAGELPLFLLDLLKGVSWCTNCGGPFFTFFRRRIVFCTVAVYYRLPLLEEQCSPHGTAHCKPFPAGG